MGEHLMAILQFDAEISRGQHLDDAPLELYVLLTTHRRAEPYALWWGRSIMTTPPDPSGNAEITDEFPEARALSAATATAAARYVEDRRELLGGHAVRLLRNGAETFPAWLEAIASARVRV